MNSDKFRTPNPRFASHLGLPEIHIPIKAKFPAQIAPSKSVHVCGHLHREHLSNPSLRQQVASAKSVQTHSANLQQIHPQRTAPRSQEIPNLRQANIPAQHTPSESVPVCAHLNREHLSNPSLRQQVASAKSVQTHSANLQQIHPERTAPRSQEIPNLRQAKIQPKSPHQKACPCAHTFTVNTSVTHHSISKLQAQKVFKPTAQTTTKFTPCPTFLLVAAFFATFAP
jgi:protein-tyrosine-phosphatase